MGSAVQYTSSVDAVSLAHQADEDPKKIQFHARSFKHGDLRGAGHLARREDTFQNVEDHAVAPLPDRISILFRHGVAVAIKELVEIAGFLEDGNIKIILLVFNENLSRPLRGHYIARESVCGMDYIQTR